MGEVPAVVPGNGEHNYRYRGRDPAVFDHEKGYCSQSGGQQSGPLMYLNHIRVIFTRLCQQPTCPARQKGKKRTGSPCKGDRLPNLCFGDPAKKHKRRGE